LSTGKYYSQGLIKKGLREEKWTFWKINGKKSEERYYKSGTLIDKVKF